MKNNFLLETERLILKQFSKNDYENIKKILKDPILMKFSINGSYTSDKEIKELIDNVLEDQKKIGCINLVSIFLKNSNQFIGYIVVTFEMEKNDIFLDLGYRFFKNFWNKGYAQESLKVYSSYLYKEAKDKKVYCNIESKNIASINVAKKCNFKYVKETFFHGKKVKRYILKISK